jgi:hypothetical protein
VTLETHKSSDFEDGKNFMKYIFFNFAKWGPKITELHISANFFVEVSDYRGRAFLLNDVMM